jgi:hypothetical protein
VQFRATGNLVFVRSIRILFSHYSHSAPETPCESQVRFVES